VTADENRTHYLQTITLTPYFLGSGGYSQEYNGMIWRGGTPIYHTDIYYLGI